MARTFATVEISVVGNVVPVLNALQLMRSALDGHRHVWTEDELAVVDLAIDLLRQAGESPTIVRGTAVVPRGEG